MWQQRRLPGATAHALLHRRDPQRRGAHVPVGARAQQEVTRLPPRGGCPSEAEAPDLEEQGLRAELPQQEAAAEARARGHQPQPHERAAQGQDGAFTDRAGAGAVQTAVRAAAQPKGRRLGLLLQHMTAEAASRRLDMNVRPSKVYSV